MLVENMAKGKYIFMQLGFSSNVTLDMVALTNFVKLFNFCGRLYSLQSSGQTFERLVLRQ